MAKRPSAADRRAEERKRIRDENAEERRQIAAEKAEAKRSESEEREKADRAQAHKDAFEQMTFPNISQADLLMLAVLVAFLLYLAMNGRLATYWTFLMGGAAPSGSPGASAAAQPNATQAPATSLKIGRAHV